MATPASAAVAFGFARVSVRVEVLPTAVATGAKAFAAVGAASTRVAAVAGALSVVL